MDKKQLSIANLSDTTIQEVRSLKKRLVKKKGEKVILIAYESHNQD